VSLASDLAAALSAIAPAPVSFVEFLTSDDYCGLTLSPALRAIAEASEGLRVTELSDTDVERIFKCSRDKLPTTPRGMVCIGAGRGGGKTSRLLAPKALHAAWTVPVPNLSAGEPAKALLIAPQRKLARQTFQMVLGYARNSSVIAPHISEERADSFVVTRPDGTRVTIEVASAGKGGASVRGFTILYLGMDEASFFEDAEYQVNDRDIYEAAEPRIVPGGQAFIASTPWVEGKGLLEQTISTEWGKHETALVAARVSTRDLNPTWDLTGEKERAMRKRPDGDTTVQREIYAVPLPRGATSFFDPTSVSRALTSLPPDSRVVDRGAAIDLGFENDHSALVVASRLANGHFTVDLVWSRAPQAGIPLVPSAVRTEMCDILRAKALTSVWSDGFARSDTVDQFGARNISVHSAPSTQEARVQTYMAAREALVQGRLHMGALEETLREPLADQFASIVRKALSGGRVEVSAPRSRMGKGHADILSAIVLALHAVGCREGVEQLAPSVAWVAPSWSQLAPSAGSAHKMLNPASRDRAAKSAWTKRV